MTTTIPAHPAKFPPSIVDAIGEVVLDYFAPLVLDRPPVLLDPFAGVGGIHRLRPDVETYGVELEPEWAQASPHTRVGDATDLTEWGDNTVDVVATSPCYGNRMADHHDAQERCTACAGTGHLAGTRNAYAVDVNARHAADHAPCPKCNGTGQRDHRRITYRHRLGRDLSAGSAAELQWGSAYRRFHIVAWQEALRVTRPGGLFVLNIKDHVRGGKLQRVPEWHVQTLQALGARLYRAQPIATAGMGFGANRDSRSDFELVIAFIVEDDHGVQALPL